MQYVERRSVQHRVGWEPGVRHPGECQSGRADEGRHGDHHLQTRGGGQVVGVRGRTVQLRDPLPHPFTQRAVHGIHRFWSQRRDEYERRVGYYDHIEMFAQAHRRYRPGGATSVNPMAARVRAHRRSENTVVAVTTGRGIPLPFPSPPTRYGADALVVVDADRHTGYGLNQCIVDLVDGYLIRLKIPKNETVCR